MTGQPYAAYHRLEAPKYELMVSRGAHVWFRDGEEVPEGGKNPDCLFFETNMPGVAIPGCEERLQLIGPARQQEITRLALVSFFNAFLKEDPDAHERLRSLGDTLADAELVHEER